MTACRHCARDLPGDVHHLVRYCPDRPCRRDARLATRKRRRKESPLGAGSARKIGGRRVVFLPGHPLDCGSGWVGMNRAELYDLLNGTDPACLTCSAPLDWTVGTAADRRVCAVRASDGLVALCQACLAGLSVAGTWLGCRLHPLTWASVGDSYGTPMTNGGSRIGERAADPGTDDLAAAADSLETVWDGTSSGARLLAAAATVLDLRARRG